jgi:HAD superfamily hydrolase (TIGR01509 family)
MARFKALLTDIDGTMAHSETVHRDGFKQVAKAYYGIELSEQQLDEINGRGAKARFQLVQDELAKAGKNPNVSEQEFRDHLAAYFMTNWKKIEAMPGAGKLLREANESGMRTAAVTNSQADVAAVALASLKGEQNRLEFTISIEDVKEGKPSPEGYIKGAAKLGFTTPEERRQVLALEDSLVGVEAAKRAGLTVIQIQHDPKHIHPQADLVVPRWDDPRVAKFMGLERGLDARPVMRAAMMVA